MWTVYFWFWLMSLAMCPKLISSQALASVASLVNQWQMSRSKQPCAVWARPFIITQPPNDIAMSKPIHVSFCGNLVIEHQTANQNWPSPTGWWVCAGERRRRRRWSQCKLIWIIVNIQIHFLSTEQVSFSFEEIIFHFSLKHCVC